MQLTDISEEIPMIREVWQSRKFPIGEFNRFLAVVAADCGGTASKRCCSNHVEVLFHWLVVRY